MPRSGEGVFEIPMPERILQIFKNKPRIVFKKELYGIYPLPIDVIKTELAGSLKDFEIIAVPKAFMK